MYLGQKLATSVVGWIWSEKVQIQRQKKKFKKKRQKEKVLKELANFSEFPGLISFAQILNVIIFSS